MNPNEFGRRLGIGVRVAGRVARQQVQQQAQQQTRSPTPVPAPVHSQLREQVNVSRPHVSPAAVASSTHKMSRAAGRGLGGFLRPFGRVGGILWLEVTGFFFGLFALYFAQDIWRTRLSYAQGPQHQRFLVAVVLTAIFGYLCVSAFWRARRR